MFMDTTNLAFEGATPQVTKATELTEIYFHSCCRPSGGEMKAALVIKQANSTPKILRKVLGIGNHIEAEWQSMFWAIKVALHCGIRALVLKACEQPVTLQTLGTWAINDAKYKPYLQRYESLKDQFASFTLQLVSKHDNPAYKVAQSI